MIEITGKLRHGHNIVNLLEKINHSRASKSKKARLRLSQSHAVSQDEALYHFATV
jgi:hypothetical protein